MRSEPLKNSQSYIPALRFNVLTSLYDPLIRWFMPEEQFKRRLLQEARIKPGFQALDLGCGTGTLALMLKQETPEARVYCIDSDPHVLSIARAKAAESGMEILFQEGMAFNLPYPENTFDRVLTSLVLHHLTTENKKKTLSEIFRVLRPGGELHVADFARPQGLWATVSSLVVRWLEEAHDNIKGLIPEMIKAAKFTEIEEYANFSTIFGTISLIRARKDSSWNFIEFQHH